MTVPGGALMISCGFIALQHTADRAAGKPKRHAAVVRTQFYYKLNHHLV